MTWLAFLVFIIACAGVIAYIMSVYESGTSSNVFGGIFDVIGAFIKLGLALSYLFLMIVLACIPISCMIAIAYALLRIAEIV